MPATDDRLSFPQKIVQLPTEHINNHLNCARGVWPLIAQMFETTVMEDYNTK